ncbi:MAG: metal-dependent transcriptional regulator [Candidatus Thorarchaeota archaeon]
MLDLDYQVLKELFKEQEMKVGKLAKKLDLPHSTVGSCIKRLEKKELVIYERYKPVSLTSNGKELAIELTRHARLLEMLLINEFKMEPTKAHDECEKFNLLISCELINKICQKYNHPKKCPCGDDILNSSGCYCKSES